jgi:hypothetical protein
LHGDVSTPEAAKFATIRVHRPAKKDDYSVPAERSQEAATIGARGH